MKIKVDGLTAEQFAGLANFLTSKGDIIPSRRERMPITAENTHNSAVFAYITHASQTLQGCKIITNVELEVTQSVSCLNAIFSSDYKVPRERILSLFEAMNIFPQGEQQMR